MSQFVISLGWFIVLCGLLIEFVAFAAMACYPLRRALPFKSPLQIQSLGCACFYAGFLILLIGQFLG